MNNTVLQKTIQTAKPEDLIEIYLSIEPRVLPILENEKKNRALREWKSGNTKTAHCASDLMQQCLQK